ncbi:MAG: outer membrane protein assembly factor BamA [Rhodothalassiaceae bacterium]
MPGFAQADDRIARIEVVGNERIEAGTVISYLTVRPGDRFDPTAINESLKSLVATELFADVALQQQGNILFVVVQENPIINRIIFEGNRRLDDDELVEEIQLRPRLVYTRAKVRADVQRILELYRAKGRFAAIVEPKAETLSQNRVNLVFEIAEGPKSKIRRINFIGNREYSDGELRDQLVSEEARFWKFFTSFDTYDPDRLAFDAEELRNFYLDEGYADFRVISQVSELTPDREDFIVTFVVEEGEVYRFGDIKIESEIKDIDPDAFRAFLAVRPDQLYSATRISDSVDNLTNAAGILGYAFVNIDVRPRRNRADRTIDLVFYVERTPRVYVERVEIRGNVRTLDRVIRREMQVAEGDAFNLNRLERSRQRIQRLGFFQEVEVEQLPGTQEDRVVLDVSVEEEATGSLTFGAAFSNLERFSFNFALEQRNWLGKGQNLRFALSLSGFRNQASISFTEPYLFGRNIAGGVDVFRISTDNEVGGIQLNVLEQTSIGLSLRTALPLADFLGLQLNYTIRNDDRNFPGNVTASPFLSIIAQQQGGEFLTSALGYSLFYDTLNNPLRPTRGVRAILGQQLAGLGGDINFIRTSLDIDYFRPLWFGFVLRLGAEGGFIEGLGEPVRTNDAFFLGGPRIRGFENRGVGPRLFSIDTDGSIIRGIPLGGNAFYLGTAELFVPLGEAVRELGVQASAFVDAGSLFDTDTDAFPGAEQLNIFDENQLRLSVGVGVSWQSPFGPFRVDLAFPLQSADGFDDERTLQFNVGTTF